MIDTRGLSCPTPVLLTQKALQETHPSTLEVLAGEAVAVENITRLAHHMGYHISVAEEGPDFRLTLTKA